jgi:hypothetical protein
VIKKSLEHQTTVLSHVMAHWKDMNLTKRVNLRIQLLSGDDPDQLVNCGVSTDQKAFIIGVRFDDSFMTPEQAFHCHTCSCPSSN